MSLLTLALTLGNSLLNALAHMTVADPGHLVRGEIYMFHIFSGNFRQTYTNYRLKFASRKQL